LEKLPNLQYAYLQGIMGLGATTKDKKTANPDASEEPNKVQITSDMQELYIKLLCQYDPAAVYQYLFNHDDYRLDYCLQVCKNSGIVDATAYLLERTGDVAGALQLILTTVDDRLKKLTAVHKKNPQDRLDSLKETKDTETTLMLAITLCQRNSQRMDDNESEALWFRLLDKFVIPLRNIKSSSKKSTDTKLQDIPLQQLLIEFIHVVLRNMTGYVPLPSILRKIVVDHGADEFGEFKSVIQGMLDTYSYESTLLETANHLLSKDMYRSTRQLIARRNRAVSPLHSQCGICDSALGDALQGSTTAVNVFSCGHSFHEGCLGASTLCPICTSSSKKKIDIKSTDNEKKDSSADTTHKDDNKGLPADKDVSAENKKYIKRLNKASIQKVDRPKYEIMQEIEAGKIGLDKENAGPKLRLEPRGLPQENIATIGERRPGALVSMAPKHRKEIDSIY